MSCLHANYYSCGKYRFATPAPADESVLYSEGRYKTKLTAHDMPPWYMRGLYYGYADGFLNTKMSPSWSTIQIYASTTCSRMTFYTFRIIHRQNAERYSTQRNLTTNMSGVSTSQNSCTWQSGTAAMIPPPFGSRSKKSASGSNTHTRMTTNARSVI